jgi:hypothetical protein
LVNLWNAVS